MLRHVAPAGAPVRVTDLARWARQCFSDGDAPQLLSNAIATRFQVRHSFVTSTGRAGLTVLLNAMRQLAPSHRDEVLLPSYTCYSVAASVLKAGLTPRIVDIGLDTLDYRQEDLAAENCERVLAVIATNLYGLPSDMPRLHRFTRERGVFLIDDAAQAMGALVGGRPSGSWGDAGLFSFDKGKNVSAIDGGAIVTNHDDLAEVLGREVINLVRPTAAGSAAHIMKVLIYFAMLRPWLYAIPARIPGLGLGRTVFTTDFPLGQPDPALAALALTMLRRLDDFTRQRVTNAAAIMKRLAGFAGIEGFTPHESAVPVYLRLPILFATPATRSAALAALNSAQIGATGSYPAALVDVPEVQRRLANPKVEAANGRRIAGCIATLPTHPFVTAADISRMVEAIERQTGHVRLARDFMTPAQL